jgi:dolichol-phosphate mannosyltransferase
VVIDEFNRFVEHGRMTRALIDWLGFERDYVSFQAAPRFAGEASYSVCKLIRLALNSFISLSLFPLKLAGYLGVFIIFTVGPFGLYVLVGKYFAHWPFASSFSGPAQLAFLLLFMVGIILSALGLISLYVASIHGEVINRPLYVLKRTKNKDEAKN